MAGKRSVQVGGRTYKQFSKKGSTAFQRKLLAGRLARIARLGDEKAREIAQFIVDRANELAPVGTDPDDADGEQLKGSYKVEADDTEPGYAITNGLRYWQFVEFGTSQHGDAQPHLRPAMDEARARYKF